MLVEGIREADLKYMVSPIVSIDEYTSKIDDDNITIAFFCKQNDVAQELKDTIEKSFYTDIEDIEVSNTLTANNEYIVFVELKRNINFVEKLLNIIETVKFATNEEQFKFKTIGLKEQPTIDEENIKNHIRMAKLDAENEDSEDVNESFTLEDNGLKITYLVEHINLDEFNKCINEAELLESYDPIKVQMLEKFYPNYNIVSTDKNIFMIKDDKIIKLS